MGIPICGACRRPIEERIVTALGKHWHVEVSITFCAYLFSDYIYWLINNKNYTNTNLFNYQLHPKQLLFFGYLARKRPDCIERLINNYDCSHRKQATQECRAPTQ